jgi:hypothetical protein
VKQTLKEGSGRVFVRDYAHGDLAQARLARKQQKLADHFFARGDGTRAYYFSEVNGLSIVLLLNMSSPLRSFQFLRLRRGWKPLKEDGNDWHAGNFAGAFHSRWI